MLKQKSVQTKLGTIIIIDDNPNIRESIKMILEDEFALTFFENGMEAIEHIRHISPDLVISDISMRSPEKHQGNR